jgi:hypothetical protein
MKILILALFSVFISGCALFREVPGSYAKVSVGDESVMAAAEFAVAAQQSVMQVQASSTEPVSLSLLQIQHARQQVVAGVNYRLNLKVKVNDEVKQASALVWYQAWRSPDPFQLTSWTWE